MKKIEDLTEIEQARLGSLMAGLTIGLAIGLIAACIAVGLVYSIIQNAGL